MDRATKLLVIGWALAALAAYIWLLAPGWPPLVWMAAAAFAAAAVLASLDRRAVAAVLVLTYVFPAIIGVLRGRYHIDYDVVWLSALLGIMVPDGVRTPWHLPARWRGALVLWALVVVAAASIVFARELDFYPGLLGERGVGSSAAGSGGPAFVLRWILHRGLLLVLGILWFDWLFGASLNFHRAIATPLFVSAMGLAAASIYQTFVDFSFLNVNVFGGTGRASGTTFDANVSGAIAAFWTGGAILWASALGRWRWPAMALAVPAAWIAVWASGSRTALASASVATAFALGTVIARREGVTLRRAIVGAAAAAAIAAVIVTVLASAGATIVGPAKRLEGTIPTASLESWRWFASQMWDRNRYGTFATEIIRDFPWFGVGVGSFELLLPDYAIRAPINPDNAQNWYRHQLAELGVIGSLGWIAWVGAFAWFVVRPPPGAPAGVWAARGMLLGFAAISLVGMPAQAVGVTITFWTVAFWFVDLAGAPPAKPLTRRAWAAVAAVVAAFTAGTAHMATTDLRVPNRAQRAGWPYSYGFYYPEPDDSGGEYRWARRRASMVIEAPSREMTVSVRVNHRDLETHPVDVKVWIDGELAVDTTLRDGKPVEAKRVIPDGRPRVVVDTWVSRVVRPSDLGVADSRELGLMVKWTFS